MRMIIFSLFIPL